MMTVITTVTPILINDDDDRSQNRDDERDRDGGDRSILVAVLGVTVTCKS